MSDSSETFPVSLAGKRWNIPHLPFRLVKKIQPGLFEVYAAAGGENMAPATLSSLGEESLDRLANLTWAAISSIEPELTYEAFLDLPFTVGDLIAAFPSVAAAAGLRQAQPGEATAGEAPGK